MTGERTPRPEDNTLDLQFEGGQVLIENFAQLSDAIANDYISTPYVPIYHESYKQGPISQIALILYKLDGTYCWDGVLDLNPSKVSVDSIKKVETVMFAPDEGGKVGHGSGAQATRAAHGKYSGFITIDGFSHFISLSENQINIRPAVIKSDGSNFDDSTVSFLKTLLLTERIAGEQLDANALKAPTHIIDLGVTNVSGSKDAEHHTDKNKPKNDKHRARASDRFREVLSGNRTRVEYQDTEINSKFNSSSGVPKRPEDTFFGPGGLMYQLFGFNPPESMKKLWAEQDEKARKEDIKWETKNEALQDDAHLVYEAIKKAGIKKDAFLSTTSGVTLGWILHAYCITRWHMDSGYSKYDVPSQPYSSLIGVGGFAISASDGNVYHIKTSAHRDFSLFDPIGIRKNKLDFANQDDLQKLLRFKHPRLRGVVQAQESLQSAGISVDGSYRAEFVMPAILANYVAKMGLQID